MLDLTPEVPVHVIPCVEGRTEEEPAPLQASRWASIIPAAWSFMLAARAHGLGTVWTPFHLMRDRKAAGILGIPYEAVMLWPLEARWIAGGRLGAARGRGTLGRRSRCRRTGG